MGGGDRRESREERRAAEYALGVVRVKPDLLPLAGRQRRSLLPDQGRYRDAADIVDERAPPNLHEVGLIETAVPPRRGCERSHSRRVTDQVPGREIGEVPHRRQCAVDRLALKRHVRARLAGKKLLPHRSAGLERQDLRGVVGEPVGDRRVEGAAGSFTDDASGEVVAAEHALERRIAGHVGDAHRQWDLVAFRAARVTLAVPALGEVGELRPNGGGKTEPVAEHLADLAERGDKTFELPGCLRKLASGLHGAYRRGATRRG